MIRQSSPQQKDTSSRARTIVLTLSALSGSVLLPAVVSAQTLGGIMTELFRFVQLLPPLFLAIALLVFFWGLVVFVWQAGDDQGRAHGRQVMIWGVVGLFVIVALWGIVTILLNILGIDDSVTCRPPQIGESGVSTCD